MELWDTALLARRCWYVLGVLHWIIGDIDSAVMLIELYYYSSYECEDACWKVSWRMVWKQSDLLLCTVVKGYEYYSRAADDDVVVKQYVWVLITAVCLSEKEGTFKHIERCMMAGALGECTTHIKTKNIMNKFESMTLSDSFRLSILFKRGAKLPS